MDIELHKNNLKAILNLYFRRMYRTEVEHILILCLLCGVTTTLATTSCATGRKSSECYQSCRPEECKCNTTETTAYNTCNQTCLPLYCFDEVRMTCIAEQNCTQVCQPGLCDMKCSAGKFCRQKAENGAKTMSCSSKECRQDCIEGQCNVMHCEAENCLQTCGKGGCRMNCTESVKKCSQSCTANTECILECRAEVCKQECSGPARCIIVNLNAASSRVLNLPVFVIALLNAYIAMRLDAF